MAAKKATGITPSTVRFGRGITAVRALPKAKGKRPAVIILHERYGIDQHTKDLTVKLAQSGFVGLAPDLFHRFTGDRKALQEGQARVDLRDDEALEDLNAAVDYLKTSSNVDEARIGIIGVCQTGRQPLLLAANSNDITGIVVLYGAIGGKEWDGNELRPTPIEKLVAQVSCPVLGIFGEADHIISVDDVVRFRGCLEWAEEDLSCAGVPRRAPRLAQRHHAGTLPQRACQGCLESDDVVPEKMLRWGLGPTANLFNL